MAGGQHFCVGGVVPRILCARSAHAKPLGPGQDADSAPKAYGRKCFPTSSQGVGTAHTELQSATFLNPPNSCARKVLHCSPDSTHRTSRHREVSPGSFSKTSAEQNSSTGGTPAAAVPLAPAYSHGDVGDKWPWEEGELFETQAATQPAWLSG